MSLSDAHWGCPACRKYCELAKTMTTDVRLSACCGAKPDPSVTTILDVVNKPAIAPWMAKMERLYLLNALRDILTDPKHPGDPDAIIKSVEALAKEKKAGEKEKGKAAEIGSAAHALIEWFTKCELGLPGPAEPPAAPDAAHWAFMAWQDWARKVNFKPMESELVLYSTQHGYIGTADTIAYVNDVLTLVDYKTGKAVYREAHLQNVAYRSGYAETHGGDWLAGLVLRLPKVDTDPEFEPVEVTAGPEALPAFLGFKAGWEWLREQS